MQWLRLPRQIANWSLTGLVVALSVGRFAIRRVNPGRWHWDDLAHLLALLTLIAFGAVNDQLLNARDSLAAALAGPSPADNPKLLGLYARVSYLDVVAACLFFLTAWTVKVAFLLFYRFLFKTSLGFRMAWWAVLGGVLVTFWAPVAGIITQCAWARSLTDYATCNSLNFFHQTRLVYTCAVDVVSDLAVMCLPLAMLVDLKIPLGQKLGLAAIFSLALVCVALDILRTIQSLQASAALYAVIAVNLNVLVSCLPTYRALWAIRARKRESSRASPKTSKWNSSWASSSPALTPPSGRELARSVSRSEVCAMRNGDGDQLSPTKIHVKSDVAVVVGEKHGGVTAYCDEV